MWHAPCWASSSPIASKTQLSPAACLSPLLSQLTTLPWVKTQVHQGNEKLKITRHVCRHIPHAACTICHCLLFTWTKEKKKNAVGKGTFFFNHSPQIVLENKIDKKPLHHAIITLAGTGLAIHLLYSLLFALVITGYPADLKAQQSLALHRHYPQLHLPLDQPSPRYLLLLSLHFITTLQVPHPRTRPAPSSNVSSQSRWGASPTPRWNPSLTCSTEATMLTGQCYERPSCVNRTCCALY